jgi:DnaJ-class molecular chaperone
VGAHPDFERRGDDLKAKVRISLREALTGFARTLRQLDGRDVVVSKAAGAVTRPFEVLTVLNEGMPLHTVRHA